MYFANNTLNCSYWKEDSMMYILTKWFDPLTPN